MNRRTICCYLATLAICLVGMPQCDCTAQEPTAKAPTRDPHYERQEFTSEQGEKLAYWLMKPERVEEGKKYPFVLALHGRAGNAHAATVLGGERMRSRYPCFVMAPAVSRSEVWKMPSDRASLRGKPMLPVVLEAVESLKSELPVDAGRVYVIGQSMGGFGSFAAIATRPETFAAAIPICGGWDRADAKKIKDVPIWVFHGAKDRTVPVTRSRDMVEALRQAGGKPKYTEYPDGEHSVWNDAFRSAETWTWLFAQRRGE